MHQNDGNRPDLRAHGQLQGDALSAVSAGGEEDGGGECSCRVLHMTVSLHVQHMDAVWRVPSGLSEGHRRHEARGLWHPIPDRKLRRQEVDDGGCREGRHFLQVGADSLAVDPCDTCSFSHTQDSHGSWVHCIPVPQALV